MVSLPVFQLMPDIESQDIFCKRICIRGVKKVNRPEVFRLFPKFKKLLISDKMYALAPQSIDISNAVNYTIQIPYDGCFDIICHKCGLFYRVLTRGSIAILQIEKIAKLKSISHKNVGKFIPSPLAVFVRVKPDINQEEDRDDREQDDCSDYESSDICDEEEFDFMFSNENEPFVGGLKDVTPLLL